jgi:hypothetical protein
MTTTRLLAGVLLVGMAAAEPVAAQYPVPTSYPPPSRTAGPVPSVLPAGAREPDLPVPRDAGMPPGRPPAAASLDQMTSGTPVGLPPGADPVGTLNDVGRVGLPPGSYASPWYTDGPGCCGPVGRNGPVEYELYARTGPNWAFGSGAFTDRLNAGWTVAGGGRSLFYNRTGDAAWAFDIGLSYQYNRGTPNDMVNLFIRQPPQQNPITGAAEEQPDVLTSTRIRGLHRTAVTFAVGRDWWAWGPGNPGAEAGWNLRYGVDVGGRWGTAHVDLVPENDPTQYARRQKVFQGVYLGFHTNFEVPVGGWIWCSGIRAQWGYDWMDIVPPIKGDVQYVDLLVTTGFRF